MRTRTADIQLRAYLIQCFVRRHALCQACWGQKTDAYHNVNATHFGGRLVKGGDYDSGLELTLPAICRALRSQGSRAALPLAAASGPCRLHLVADGGEVSQCRQTILARIAVL